MDSVVLRRVSRPGWLDTFLNPTEARFYNYLNFVRFSKMIQFSKASGIVGIVDLE